MIRGIEGNNNNNNKEKKNKELEIFMMEI